MLDLEATEDFINKTICDKHRIPTILTENPCKIYLVNSNLSKMTPITHIAKVLSEIGGHREIATLQVANPQHHKIILDIPWLKEHDLKIDWENEKITFDSEQCITWCLDQSATIYPVLGHKAQEEILITWL